MQKQLLYIAFALMLIPPLFAASGSCFILEEGKPVQLETGHMLELLNVSSLAPKYSDNIISLRLSDAQGNELDFSQFREFASTYSFVYWADMYKNSSAHGGKFPLCISDHAHEDFCSLKVNDSSGSTHQISHYFEYIINGHTYSYPTIPAYPLSSNPYYSDGNVFYAGGETFRLIDVEVHSFLPYMFTILYENSSEPQQTIFLNWTNPTHVLSNGDYIQITCHHASISSGGAWGLISVFEKNTDLQIHPTAEPLPYYAPAQNIPIQEQDYAPISADALESSLPQELPPPIPELYNEGAPTGDEDAFKATITDETAPFPSEQNSIIAAEPKKDGTTGAQESELDSFLQKNMQEMAFFALGAISIIALAIFAFYFRHGAPAPYPQELSIGDTQMQILDELSEVQKIPTDISRSVQKSKSTVVEHLDSLCRMGLVERIALPSKKFVYYRLTQNGRILLLKRRQAA